MPMDLDQELEDLAHEVIGAAIEVHHTLGPGYGEQIYERAMSVELELRGIDHTCQSPVRVLYKGVEIGEGRLDILVHNQIIVELKTVDALAAVHQAQVIAYLKATNKKLGLLMNFKTAVLKDGLRRIVL